MHEAVERSAYIHEDVLSTVVSVWVPETATRHSARQHALVMSMHFTDTRSKHTETIYYQYWSNRDHFYRIS